MLDSATRWEYDPSNIYQQLLNYVCYMTLLLRKLTFLLDGDIHQKFTFGPAARWYSSHHCCFVGFENAQKRWLHNAYLPTQRNGGMRAGSAQLLPAQLLHPPRESSPYQISYSTYKLLISLAYSVRPIALNCCHFQAAE